MAKNIKSYPKHNTFVHVMLAIFTFGIGNYFYYVYVKHKQQTYMGLHSKAMLWAAIGLWVLAGLAIARLFTDSTAGSMDVLICLVSGVVGYIFFREQKKWDKKLGENLVITTHLKWEGKQMYTSSGRIASLETTLKVLNECVQLIQTSRNLEVVESRRSLGLERVKDLMELERAGHQFNGSTASEFDDFFQNKALEYIDNLKTPKHFDLMDGHEFERFCANLLLKDGFNKAEVTVGSGDHGVDILAEKDGITYAIQCKRSSSNIGNKAVQEIFSGKEFYKRHIGVVMTNQYFTSSAKEAAERTGIVLWDREKIAALSGAMQEA